MPPAPVATDRPYGISCIAALKMSEALCSLHLAMTWSTGVRAAASQWGRCGQVFFARHKYPCCCLSGTMRNCAEGHVIEGVKWTPYLGQ